MEIKNATFLLGVTTLDKCPPPDLPEIAFIGRSNVGKSSLINTLTGRKKLARISNSPGKTREINFYLINNNRLYLVDLPGYGYAKVSRKHRTLWSKSIEQYLLERSNLRLVLQLIDSRHEPTALDQDILIWLAENKIPFCNILTKADKLSGRQQRLSVVRLENIHDKLNMEIPILLSSSQTLLGKKEILTLIDEFTRDEKQVDSV